MRVGERVRLRVTTEAAPTGSEGPVWGWYSRNGRTEVVVALDGQFAFVDEDDLEFVEAEERARPAG